MNSVDIETLFEQYGKKSPGSLSSDDQEVLKSGLDAIKNINSKDDAHKFLQLLALLREAEVRAIGGLGKSAMATITGAFAGGDEGVYAADTDLMNARFIFELVQNVDDCKYKDVNNCSLDIQFDVVSDVIRLEYNELGFQPENVIAITGLGNSTKNHKKAENLKKEKEFDQNDLQEIGEKGIGFKSIFGLAKKVKIKSQYFSFELVRDRFFVPIVDDYKNFTYNSSTILELTLDDGMTEELYSFLKKKYDAVEAVINENPILFLNKLTQIRYCKSKKEFFGFRVSRGVQTGEYSEEETKIEYFSSSQWKNKSIEAYRFSHNIEYSVEECQARYGMQEDTVRKHKIIVIAPKKADTIKQGRIYSFFATSEEINAPFIIHAPFKLNSGRTRIDSQSQSAMSRNLWFVRTQKETIDMIRYVYERLVVLQGNKIRFYIPETSLVSDKCALYCQDIEQSNILKWNIFEDVHGNYRPAAELCMIDFDVKIEGLIEIHQLLNLDNHLLKVDSKDVHLYKNYIAVTGDVKNRLLRYALKSAEKCVACLKYINDYEPDFPIRSIASGLSFNFTQIKEISKFEKISAWINKNTFDFMKPGSVGSRIDAFYYGESKSTAIIKNYCEDYGEAINQDFVNYLNRVNYYEVDFDHPIYLFNAVFGRNMLEDLAKAYTKFVPKDKFFSLLLKIEAISEEINSLCDRGDDISDYEFLSILRTHRASQRNTMGVQYSSIIDLIEKSGTGRDRFFSEILQNIDDETVNHVTIRNEYIGDTFKLYIEYDKVSFSRDKVRAITAIGDSTKKTLLSSQTTGEKGIGFKSIFAFCSDVLIESGNFAFQLTAEKPTIPEPIANFDYRDGTRMVFTLKPRETRSVMDLLSDDQKLVKTCLCLKHLHSLQINKKKIEITDQFDHRIVKCGEKIFEYFTYIHPIRITDPVALRQRQKTKDVHETQKIEYLIPLDESDHEYCVYSTFPTQEKINIPMIINMPLELDTARERILEVEWNNEVIKQMMYGLTFVYDRLKFLKKEKLPMYFPLKGRVLEHRYGVSSFLLERIATSAFFKLALKNEFIPLYKGVFSFDFEYMLFERYADSMGTDLKSSLLAMDLDSFSRLSQLYPNYIKFRSIDEISQSIDRLLANMKRQNKELVKDKSFRDALYQFLATLKTQHPSRQSTNLIKRWEIIPIRLHKKTKYECYSEDIYTPCENNIDSEKYKILDEQTMSTEMFNLIYSSIDGIYRPIRPFSKDIIIGEFFRNISSTLQNPDFEKRAEMTLALFNSEKDLFKETYKAKKDFPKTRMYFKTRTGDFLSIEKCFLSETSSSQNCLDKIIVNEAYAELAKVVEVPKVKDISSCNQISFEIGRQELSELYDNRYIIKKAELITSLYLWENRSVELKNGVGFFELYMMTPRNIRLGQNQVVQQVVITEEILKKYSIQINEISINQPAIKFIIDFGFSIFEKDNILSEIQNELQLRKESDKIRMVMEMLSTCYYAPLFNREPCCVSMKSENILLIDSNITADYDIVEALKSYFLKYFNTELTINRNIRLYTRRGFENISTIYSTAKDVNSALPMAFDLNLNNIEDIKDFVCKPIVLNGITYGGYAKTCPLCGSVVNTELTGMRIYKTKSNGVIVPLISCSNCHENLKYSSYVNIDVEKLNEGLLDMECQINGFEWRVSNKIIRLGHRVLIKKFNQK